MPELPGQSLEGQLAQFQKDELIDKNLEAIDPNLVLF